MASASRLLLVLKPGDTLEVDNRHIAPTGVDDGILVNLPQRRLFLFRNGVLQHMLTEPTLAPVEGQGGR